jgi:RimJ/RimL family protein N-acetyltransferase
LVKKEEAAEATTERKIADPTRTKPASQHSPAGESMVVAVRIETARLILRTVTLQDTDAVAASWRLDEGPLSREEAQERIAWMLDNHSQIVPVGLRHLCLAIIDKESQTFAGWCGLDHRDRAKPHPVLFYLLKARYWGRGLAAEAAGALLGFAFRELRLAQIDGGAAFDNVASRRVMEKAGMRYLGLNEEGSHSFTITREEYSQR